MKQTFPTIDGHITELTKYATCYGMDVYGYSEHPTKREAIAAAKERIRLKGRGGVEPSLR